MTKFRGVSIGIAVICFTTSIAWGSSGTPDAPSGSQSIFPRVCPAQPGYYASTTRLPSKSEAILIPANKPSIAVPSNHDTVITPCPSSPERQERTFVPAITTLSVPDVMKKPVTLEQVLQVAFQNSPSIQAALSQVEASRDSVDEARARFNPTFNIQTSYMRQGPTTATESTGGGTIETVLPSSTTASLAVQLPLDISHQIRYSSDIAHYSFQIQYLSMVSVSQQLIVDVKSAYYDLLRACGQQDVAQAAVDSAKSRLENIRAKREEGTVPEFDLTSAEVEFGNLNQQLIAAENHVRIVQSSLNAVLGVDVNNPTQVISDDVPVTIDTVDIPKSIDEAYARRAELKAAQTAVTLSKSNVNLEKSGLLPLLNLTGGPAYDFNPNGLNPTNYSWQASAVIKIPLWDGGTAKSRVRQARAGVQNSAASLEKTKIVVATEVRQAALDLQDAALRTRTADQAVSLAEDALGIALDRFDAGIAVQVEVTNAQSQLTQARFNYVNAKYDYAVALAQLQRATASQPELNQLQLLADQGVTKQNNGEGRS
ncbi:TolC family protein [uncultured Desulfobulbus sp.]|uniref:TolC family protein n=1 Tax=uncultured Desulfobulbus sp. TaxID=239745 RepID=UPI0029C73144|nr:TolC family protein [uncultured Desulfobulbus sp.]